MRALGWLVRKDLLRFVADRNGALLTLSMPVVLAVALGFLFAPPELSVPVSVAVVDLDDTPASRELVAALRAEPGLAVEASDEPAARRRVEAGTLPAAVLLPPGAGASLRPAAAFLGGGATGTLLVDPSRPAEADLVAGLLQKVVMQRALAGLADPARLQATFAELRTLSALAGLAGRGEDDPWRAFLDAGARLAAAVAEAPGALAPPAPRPPLTFERRALVAAGPLAGYNSYAHTFAGMLCMFLLFWAVDAAKELVGEREAGSLARLRLAPVPRWQILAARAASAAAVALLISVAVYAVGMALLGVRVLGSWAGFAAVLLGQAAFAGGFALLLAGLGRTERQITHAGTFLVLVMSFAGGAWLPTFLMPSWLQAASRALPTFWATDGLAAATWRGLPLDAALVPAAVLLAAGAACAAVGLRAFRW